jgi:rare lipoprotein A
LRPAGARRAAPAPLAALAQLAPPWPSARLAPLLLLAACAAAPHGPNAAGRSGSAAGTATVLPRNAPDVDQIPDPVPRDEPRSVYGNPPFYEVGGHRYIVLASSAGYVERGVASWYGTEFHGLRTSTGEPYDMFAMTAAHKTLPLPCYARVTNLANGRSVVVRINDRGPFVANRIIDLSYTAAVKLDMIRDGTAFVQVEALTAAAPELTASLPVNLPAAAAASIGVSSVPPVSVPPPPVSGPPVSGPALTAPAPLAIATAAPVATAEVSTVTPDAVITAGATVRPAATPATVPVRSIFIQVGAYASADNAHRAAQRLRDAGLQPVLTLEPDARTPLHRVRIGPLASVRQFDELSGRLAALGFSGARLAQD